MLKVVPYNRSLLPILVELEEKTKFVPQGFLSDLQFKEYIHWKYSRGDTIIFHDDTNALGVLSQDKNGEYKGQSWGADAISVFAHQPNGRWSFAKILISYIRNVKSSGKRNLVLCEPELDKTMAKAGYKVIGGVYLLSREKKKEKTGTVTPISLSDYLSSTDWTSRLFAPSYYEDRLLNCPIARCYRCVRILWAGEEIGKVVYRIDEENKRVLILDWVCGSIHLFPLLVSSVVEFTEMEFADLIYGGCDILLLTRLGFRIEGVDYLRAYPKGEIPNCITALDLDLEEVLW